MSRSNRNELDNREALAMKFLVTAATVAISVGSSVPAVAQTSPLAPRDVGKESPLAQSPCKGSTLAQVAPPRDAGRESPLVAQVAPPRDAGRESPLIAQAAPARDPGKESPLASADEALSARDAGKQSPLASADEGCN